MGYYTQFILSHNDDITKDHEDGIAKMDDFYPFDDCYKWYEHEDDMKIYSKRFPNVLFTLYGAGEENTDMWIKYFKNGKMQVCKAKITYADYDEELLK